MAIQHDRYPVFEHLKGILKPYAPPLSVTEDTTDQYSLDGHFSKQFQKTLFFGSVQIKKNYVSFYLMPVYMYPEILETISPQLKKRMQGKSCFNFKTLDQSLFSELCELTRVSFERFQLQE